MAPEELAGTEREADDPLRHVVRVALAIYLMPVIAIVCAIGGASIVLGRAGRLAGKIRFGGSGEARPGHLPAPRLAPRPVASAGRGRDRVGR